jgi:hypothetical protein
VRVGTDKGGFRGDMARFGGGEGGGCSSSDGGGCGSTSVRVVRDGYVADDEASEN